LATDSADFAESILDFATGKAIAANIAIMAITTSSSISVKAGADLGRSSAKREGNLGEGFKINNN
jgi:hypothetical protein